MAAVNAVLGTELDPGIVRLSARAHEHMAKDHPADYPTCIVALPDVIATPTFIGQAPGHTGNFEMLRRIARPDGRVVLAAIGLQPAAGFYLVRSCYLVSAELVNNRRLAGRLFVPPR